MSRIAAWLVANKELIDVSSKIFTMVGVTIAGWWSYRLLSKQRVLSAKARVTHEVSHEFLTPAKQLVHLAVVVQNIGTVELRPTSGYSILQQVLPLNLEFAKRLESGQAYYVGDNELEWPILERRTYDPTAGDIVIEPGETERWEADFIISGDLRVVGAFSEFQILREKDAWSIQTFHRLKPPRSAASAPREAQAAEAYLAPPPPAGPAT